MAIKSRIVVGLLPLPRTSCGPALLQTVSLPGRFRWWLYYGITRVKIEELLYNAGSKTHVTACLVPDSS